MLKNSADRTVYLLKSELEIRLAELKEDWHMSSLEKIFIEEKIYRDIEECETWEAVLSAINKGLELFKERFSREITREDLIR
jgi:topoisomerase-4 subunit A